MNKRRVRNEAFDVFKHVTDAGKGSFIGAMDPTTLVAVAEHDEHEQHLEDVKKQLSNDAKIVTPEKEEDPKNSTENKYTAKLILDESIEDFKLAEDKTTDGRANKVYEDDDEDDYLDYDMFDFIYGLVTDCWPKPLDPFGRKRYKKFLYIGSDKYADSVHTETGNVTDGHAQVATGGDTIEVSHNDPTYFDDVAMILDKYKIQYTGPQERRNSNTYWKYSWTIHVPCVSSGYPYMVEEYFEDLGLTMEDVMDSKFCTQYRKRQAALEKESQAYLNQSEVDKMLEKAITAAAQDNTEPLQVHVKRLFADLDAAGLTYQKSKVKKAFMDAFDDGEEDED